MQSDEPRTNAEKPSGRVYPLWLLTLVSGLIAGSLAGFGGELTYEALHKEPQYPDSFNSMSSSERAVARGVVRFNTKLAVDTNKAMAAYGLLGAAIGVVLGVAGGLAGRSRRASPGSAVVWGVVGGAAGTGLSLAIIPLFFQLSDGVSSLPLLFLSHATIFGGIGAVGGAALGWDARCRTVFIRSVIGGIIGAAVATLAVEIVNIAAFGIMLIFEPVPSKSTPRFLLAIFVALGTAIGAALASRKARARQA